MIERFRDMGDDPIVVARRLLGQRLVRIVNRERLAGTIVEVEAYLGAADRAAHTFGGRRTARNESMYLTGGHAYVYFTYGAHFCLNVVCGKADEGVAVLIRALEPTEGLERMFANRPHARRETDLCSGPGKLAKALEIDRGLDGIDLCSSRELFIERLSKRALPWPRVGTSKRIGLNPTPKWEGDWAERHLRFFIRGNPHVSY
jgi:DNA-3-methyladenine glycosylase